MTSSIGRVCLAISALAVAALSAHLIMLARRTDSFARVAAVGADVVFLVAALCTIAIAAAIVALRATAGRMPTLLLAFNTTVAAVYLILFIIGKFGPVGKP